ncbi:hypothetical protein FPE07_002102 [Salmonella enterica subsp. enterica serovar Braenderup]|uniref:hypothetical protein n=1 Tax=Enterobacteriaceae TaxID=543 RepID=UPI0007AC5260|nr:MULTISPECIES: hypothetical protein [Enterobacteriaceae]ECK0504349.1 hypothetical protein [Salmonella enterica subsp. enterica serovar Goldcoast]EDQ8520785.1 hypothetical protein [Salmonella enterica subsp. enterica serovar Braenderup]EMC7919255.1 hypothetical protein [Enterobacter kobei]HDT6030219.1 hypothetical protein [Enterobacter cloacae subsp. cloacae]EBC3833828.1 hypothetical protein [Salmonella enterica]
MRLIYHPYFSIYISMFTSIFAFFLWLWMPTRELLHISEEGQIIETLTLYAYVFAIVIFIIMRSPKAVIRWSVVIVLLAMLAREADLHKIIADMSIFKLRFWTGELPLRDKAIAIVILSPIALAVIYLLRYTSIVLQEMHKNVAHAITIISFVVLTILTKIIDRSVGVAREIFDWHSPDWLVALQTSQEELLELSIPLLAGIAIVQYRQYMRNMG